MLLRRNQYPQTSFGKIRKVKCRLLWLSPRWEETGSLRYSLTGRSKISCTFFRVSSPIWVSWASPNESRNRGNRTFILDEREADFADTRWRFSVTLETLYPWDFEIFTWRRSMDLSKSRVDHFCVFTKNSAQVHFSLCCLNWGSFTPERWWDKIWRFFYYENFYLSRWW